MSGRGLNMTAMQTKKGKGATSSKGMEDEGGRLDTS